MAKFIFVTGGVVSGLGKGITAASLGRLLKCRGLKIAAQKLDPYINVDPGTMSPFQHGEVYVTDDGAETDLDLTRIGPKFEHHPLFPERVNTEFVNVLPDGSLKMRVWERGSGETWACGTGSCATGVAACLNGFANKNEDIVVHLRGGDLTIRYTDETVFMTGAATTVFKGEIEI